MTVYSELKHVMHNLFPSKSGTYGIEIETETKSSSNYASIGVTFNNPQLSSQGKTFYSFPGLPDWEGHEDGSLRNFGLEFVTTQPLSLPGIKTALRKWGEYFGPIEFIKDAPATSVHVHMNFQNEEIVTLGNFLTTYTIVENILLEVSGEARRSNLFALPMRVAEQQVNTICQIFKRWSDGGYCPLPMNHHKYSALNVSSLTYFGSIETRSFRGTTDVNVISGWIDILDDLLTFSRKPTSPNEVMYMAKNSLFDFFTEVFPKTKDKILEIVGAEYIEPLMSRNLFYAALISQSGKWDVINTAMSSGSGTSKIKGKKASILDDYVIQANPPPVWMAGISSPDGIEQAAIALTEDMEFSDDFDDIDIEDDE